MEQDRYKTIEAACEVTFREQSSRFIAYAFPVESREQIKEHLDALKKKYYDATHHCYAWRLGASAELSRINDDGEPSGTAGRPIMGQLMSSELTNILVVVVRYFGGTKLGVPGLIASYKESTAEVIACCKVVERTVNAHIRLEFAYVVMNHVMRVVKDMQLGVVSQSFDNLCVMELTIRRSCEELLLDRLSKCDGISVEVLGYR